MRPRIALAALGLTALVWGAQPGCHRATPAARATPFVLDILAACADPAAECSPGLEASAVGPFRPRRGILVEVPSHLEAGPVPAATGCELRVGVLAERPSQRRVVVVDDAGAATIYESPAGASGPPEWEDVTIPLAGLAGSELFVRFETEAIGSDVAGGVAWSSPHLVCPGTATGPAPAPSLLLVSIDTLRADHLGCYGREPSLTPALDALAREARVYERAYTTSPWTLPAHASMFTGLYPEEHRAVSTLEDPSLRYAMRGRTLAERLREQGYRTVALTAGGFVSSGFGLDRGFDSWTEVPEASLVSMLPLAMHHLSEPSASPGFVFLHTYDVHGPWPDPVDPRPGAELDPVWDGVASLGFHDYLDLGRYRGPAEAAEAYARGVRQADGALGSLFDWLRRTRLLQRTVVIVTSDHGESLGDHEAYFGHELTLSEPLVRIPLLVAEPGGRAGRTRELTSLVDVPSIAMEALGLAPPDGERVVREGVDLATRRGVSTASGAAFAIDYPWKVVTAVDAERATDPVWAGLPRVEQVYHLERDPSELHNLAACVTPPEVERLREALHRISVPEDFSGVDQLTPDVRQQLEALGYLARRPLLAECPKREVPRRE